MDRTKIIGCLTALLGLCGCGGGPVIRVGSKNFTEQVVLGEIIAQHLEHRLHIKVERRLDLGGTLIAHQALINGRIDLYPEYTGTALAAILKDQTSADPAADLNRVRSAYHQKFHLDWLDPLGIDNTFAMVVRGDAARAAHLTTLTDAAKDPQAWVLGVGYEFEQRSDGLAALERSYHLHFQGTPKTMDLGLLYKALDQKQVSMIAANATDGLLSAKDLKVLEDDQHAFPPYQVSVVAREDRLREIPGLKTALDELAGKFTNKTMQQLNYQVDGEHRPVTQVAADFLKQRGL